MTVKYFIVNEQCMFGLIKALKHNILLIFVFEVKPLSQINIYGQMCALFD